jgi:hypothetical protein
VCEVNESIDGVGDSVANRPKGLGEERVEEEAHPTSRKLQQGEEEAEPELMRRIRRAKKRH